MKNLIYVILAALLVSTIPAVFADTAEGTLPGDDCTLDSPVFLTPAIEKNIDGNNGWQLPGITEKPLSVSPQSYELRQRLALFAPEEPQVDEYGNYYVERPEGWRHPGKAALLSAMIPGAGELYAGSYIKSALFFAIEIGCWAGAINYGIRGEDKETEYKKYVDDTWNEDIYRTYELWLAKNYNTISNSVDPPFPPTGMTDDDWLYFDWEDKMKYLPDWFTHELPQEKSQQYYEMVGKYLQQFGVGWPEEYEHSNNYDDGVFQPNKYYTAVGEDHWYGYSVNHFAKIYSDMRYDSNQLLEMRDNFFKIVMVNHVLSALDAGFTVTRHNRRLMEAQFGAESCLHNGELVAMGKIHFRW